jgi:hypothetical protein
MNVQFANANLEYVSICKIYRPVLSTYEGTGEIYTNCAAVFA